MSEQREDPAQDQGHKFEPFDVHELVTNMKSRLRPAAQHDHRGPDPCSVCGGMRTAGSSDQ